MPEKKTQYTTVAPVTPKGKWLICSRRIGSRDRLSVIAEAKTELVADHIVDGLNSLQGEIAKLEAPAQRTLEALREQLKKEMERSRDAELKVGRLNSDYRILKEQCDRAITDRNIVQAKLDNVLKARETA